MTRIFAVAGSPVFHSKSPLMFNAAFRDLGMDAVYVRLAASDASEVVRLARENWVWTVSTSRLPSRVTSCFIWTRSTRTRS